jgi:large subunit ribosomal protein L11
MHIKDYTNIDLSKVSKVINLIAPARNAKLGPPVGPILGQAKIKVKDFCTLFNNVTVNYDENFPIRVRVFVFKDETFVFIIKTPDIHFLLKNFLNFNKKNFLNLVDIYKISLIKKTELNHLNLKTIFKNILNTVKLRNIKINK